MTREATVERAESASVHEVSAERTAPALVTTNQRLPSSSRPLEAMVQAAEEGHGSELERRLALRVPRYR